MLNGGARVEYVSTNYTLQFYLNTLQPLITPEEAVRLMSGPEPIYIVVRSTYQDRINAYLADIPFYILFKSEDVLVVSNQPPSLI
jgi:hypothetical protein